MKRNITIIVVIALLVLIVFRLFSNKKKIDAGKQVKQDTNASISVTAEPVQSKVTDQKLTLVGTVMPNKEIDIKSEVQGVIASLRFNLGDFVKEGQILAQVDSRIKSLSAATAEQNLANAQRDFERYSNLYKGGAATESQLQQFRLNYENAKNMLEQARKELSNTNIAAPISGFITKKVAEAGAFVNVGSSIATVVDVSKLKVQLSVGEADAYALHVGDPVTITTSVYPGTTFKGTITFISPRGDEAHNYPVEISIVNQDKNPLKAGTFVDIAFDRKTQKPVLQIPREAVVGSLKDAKVYVVSNNTAVLRPVTLGADYGDYMEVINGLKEGEKVVTTGQINLVNNAQVTVINNNTEKTL
jgi:RND family efflux transporter MFP subunit